MSDLDVLASRARSGDALALQALLQASQPHLRRFAARACHNPADAQDAVQHTLLVMARQMRSFRGAARFTTWVFQIIKNECARYGRLASRWVGLDLDGWLHAEPLAPDGVLENEQLAQRLAVAVASLPPPLREVFVLRDVEERSTQEVAEMLGLRSANVKVRLHRARARLRVALNSI